MVKRGVRQILKTVKNEIEKKIKMSKAVLIQMRWFKLDPDEMAYMSNLI